MHKVPALFQGGKLGPFMVALLLFGGLGWIGRCDESILDLSLEPAGSEGGFERVAPPNDLPEEDTDPAPSSREANGAQPSVEGTPEGIVDPVGSIEASVGSLLDVDNRLRTFEIGADIVPNYLDRPGGKRSVRASFTPGVRIPFVERGKVPTDAELKAGRFYFDARSLVFSSVWSDNANHEEQDKDSDYAGSVSLGSSAYFEIAEDAYIQADGAFVWLPFEGKAGVDGFGVEDIYSLTLGTLFDAGMQSEFKLKGWDLILKDDLVARDNRFEAETSEKLAIYEGEDFTDFDELGDYKFGNEVNYDDELGELEDITDDKGVEIINTASLSAVRPMPHDSDARITTFYRNYWYPDNEERAAKYTSWEYGVNYAWIFRRPEWRFNPFTLYTWTYSEQARSWTHVARAGFQGNATDQIHLYADAGWADAPGYGLEDQSVCRLAVDHVVGPFTRQNLVYERKLETQIGSTDEIARYTLEQILGPRVRGTLFGEYRDKEYGEGLGSSYQRDEAGASIFVQISPIVGFSQSAIMRHTEYNNARYRDQDIYRTKSTYILNQNSYFELIYEHRFQKTNRTRENDFRENLVSFSWVNMF